MSWSLPSGKEFLPAVSVAVLKKRLDAERGAKPRTRLNAALQRKRGWSMDEIASSLNMNRRTVHDLLWRFTERGLDAAYDVKREGRPNHLTVKQQIDLRKRLVAGPQANGFREGSWSTRMVLHLVEEKYGKKYTREHMTRVLHKLGFSPQKPRPSNAKKATEEEIKRFKKKRSGWYPTT
jgi:transposase